LSPRRAANRAASLQMLAISAPEKPGVNAASLYRDAQTDGRGECECGTEWEASVPPPTPHPPKHTQTCTCGQGAQYGIERGARAAQGYRVCQSNADVCMCAYLSVSLSLSVSVCLSVRLCVHRRAKGSPTMPHFFASSSGTILASSRMGRRCTLKMACRPCKRTPSPHASSALMTTAPWTNTMDHTHSHAHIQ
jgi:hypothetical protein